MTTQHPAAPEAETDANGLAPEQRASLLRTLDWGVESRNMPHATALQVLAIADRHPALLADLDAARERVRVVEGERDAVVEVGAYAQQKEATARAVNDAARMAQVAARRTRELAAMTARAESAEAAHEALQKECADHLRAIESAHDAALSAARIRTLEAALHAQAQQDRAETAETEVERLTEGIAALLAGTR